MSFRETIVPAPDLHDLVLASCERARPIGACATQTRAQYMFLEDQGVHVLFAPLRTGVQLEACAPELPLFVWDEREMRENGVAFSHRVPETQDPDGEHVTVAVVGPVHAGVIEPGRFTLHTAGESIERLDVALGFSKRGVQRALEGRSALDAAPIVARICGGCSVARSLAYAHALESLAGVECDEEIALARVVFAELERIYNHLFDLASTAAGAGYGRAQFGGLHLKERAMRINAKHAGHRLLFDSIVPGGIASGLLEDMPALRRDLTQLRDDVLRYLERFFAADSMVSRLKGAGVLTPEAARAHGTVGPALRASGEGFDVRAAAPYGGYRSLDVDISTASAGDVNARCHVKADELLVSFSLIDRALDAIGERVLGARKAIDPRGGRTVALSEGPRGLEALMVECDAGGSLRNFHAISASYRNWPAVTAAMRDNIVPDFPLVNKSFNLCYACVDR